MRIEIELSQKEALEIIIKDFQPMFPEKVITGEIKSYGNVNLVVTDKKTESEGKPNEE
jgi:hypothetical protein